MPEQSGIFFRDEGKGFPVVLIHGFCETHQIWNSFSKKLSSHYRVISLDLPGFGMSPLLKEPFSIKDVATKVLTWLNASNIQNSFVMGHSLGGYVTLAMVEQQPTVFNGFGLFHSTAFADSDEKKLSRNKVIEFVSNNGVAPFIESFIPPLFFDQHNPSIPEVVKLALTTKKETLLAYVQAMRDRPDRTNVLRSFTNPVLFISGEMDGVVSPESITQQSKLVTLPTVHVMKGVAHMGMFENENKSLELTRNFLDQNCL
jgi:pimeloyl-ACP methyl ester carboxylesterase